MYYLGPVSLFRTKVQGIRYQENLDCHEEWKTSKEEKNLKCQQFAFVSNNFGEYVKNQDVMTRSASEDVETYVDRQSEEFVSSSIMESPELLVVGWRWCHE